MKSRIVIDPKTVAEIDIEIRTVRGFSLRVAAFVALLKLIAPICPYCINIVVRALDRESPAAKGRRGTVVIDEMDSDALMRQRAGSEDGESAGAA